MFGQVWRNGQILRNAILILEFGRQGEQRHAISWDTIKLIQRHSMSLVGRE